MTFFRFFPHLAKTKARPLANVGGRFSGYTSAAINASIGVESANGTLKQIWFFYRDDNLPPFGTRLEQYSDLMTEVAGINTGEGKGELRSSLFKRVDAVDLLTFEAKDWTIGVKKTVESVSGRSYVVLVATRG